MTTTVDYPSPVIELLASIASGIVIYEPFRRTGRELQEFQDTVVRLQAMKEAGLVKMLSVQTHSIAGATYYDLAMVQGGLTEEGTRVLAEHQSQTATCEETA